MSTITNGIRIIDTSSRRHHRMPSPRPIYTNVSDPTPLLITDDVLFRWARIIHIANVFPTMHAVRDLENRIQSTECRSCKKQPNTPRIDRNLLNEVRRLLAECSDDKARLVKEAAGIVKYRVQYHDLSGTVRDIVR